MKRKTFLLNGLGFLPVLPFVKTFQSFSRNKEPFIIRNGHNRSGKPMMKYMGVHPNDVLISRKDTDNELSLFLFQGFGNVSTPLHVHYNQDEFFFVADGNYRFVCAKEVHELKQGDTIFLPKNIPHQWIQLSEKGTMIYGVNPAGELEDFFQEVNNLTNPTQSMIDELALKHGMKHIGPPLTIDKKQQPIEQ